MGNEKNEHNPVRTLLTAAACCIAGAGLIWIPVIVYAAHFNTGQRDMAGAFLTAIVLFGSGSLILVCAALVAIAIVVHLFHHKRVSRATFQ